MNGFVLHLQGPMMSFGDTGFGQLRDAGSFPSRSAVIGVIAAALGVERGEERLLELHRQLRVHIGVARIGEWLVDYHTVLPNGYEEYDGTELRRRGAEGNPVLTDRTYHVDAHFVAVVASDNVELLQECRNALYDPMFTTYLGRRSCVPATPFLPIDIPTDSTLIDALWSAARSAEADRVKALLPWMRRTADALDVYLDAPSFDTPSTCVPSAVERSFRRDLLTAVPRSYVNRPVLHVRLSIPLPPDSSNTTKEFFDATL